MKDISTDADTASAFAVTELQIHPSGSFSDREAMAVLDGSDVAMVITDPTQPDNPVVYVNSAFERVTLYPRAAVIGRNCRFMQGPDTDPEDIARLREAVARGIDTTVDILNYRADGTPFHNRLLLSAIRDESGKVRLYLGLQRPLSAEEERRSWSAAMATLRETQHRLKNHLALLGSLIRLHARDSADRAGFRRVASRVESLQALYAELSDSAGGRDGETVELGPLLRRLADTVLQVDGRPGLSVGIDVPAMRIASNTAATLAMVASEIVTNAVKHAFPGREQGRIAITAAHDEDGSLRLSIADDGVGMPESAQWPNSASVGGRVIGGLIRTLGADLGIERPDSGTRITLVLPPEQIPPAAQAG